MPKDTNTEDVTEDVVSAPSEVGKPAAWRPSNKEGIEMPKDTKTEDVTEDAVSAPSEVGKPAAPVVNWDDSQMRTTYANVVNAASTREEVTLFFGSNQTWNPGAKQEFDVRLEERIVLNPHAAKRLFVLIGAVLAQYEKRFGDIRLEGLEAAAEILRKSQSKNSAGDRQA